MPEPITLEPITDLIQRVWCSVKGDEGVFHPGDVATPQAPIEAVKRRLRRRGWIEPVPQRDGFWVVTQAGRQVAEDAATAVR